MQRRLRHFVFFSGFTPYRTTSVRQIWFVACLSGPALLSLQQVQHRRVRNDPCPDERQQSKTQNTAAQSTIIQAGEMVAVGVTPSGTSMEASICCACRIAKRHDSAPPIGIAINPISSIGSRIVFVYTLYRHSQRAGDCIFLPPLPEVERGGKHHRDGQRKSPYDAVCQQRSRHRRYSRPEILGVAVDKCKRKPEVRQRFLIFLNKSGLILGRL